MAQYFYIALFILIIPAAFSEEMLFSGKVLTDSNILTKGESFRFYYDESSQKIFAQNPNINLIVDLYGCKLNSKYKICINSANFSYRNLTTYKNYYEIYVEVYKLEYGINFSSIYVEKMLQNENQRFTFNFLNPTTKYVENLSISLKILNFTVNDVKGCEFDGDYILWRGMLSPSDYKSCSMGLISQSKGAFSIIGNASYTIGADKIENKINLATIEVLSDQLLAGLNANSRADVGEIFYFNVSVKNINPNEDMDVIAKILFPKEAYFVNSKPHYFDLGANALKDSFVLQPGKSKNYSFMLKSEKEMKISRKLWKEFLIKSIFSMIILL